MQPETLTLPAGFQSWNEWAQGATLAGLTMVSEDGVTIGAALLAAIGVLNLPTAFWGTYLGIWIGDACLYVLARVLGRPLLRRRWAARFIAPERLKASEHWFATRGAAALLLSRFIPGTRLPTFLAAGLLRMPFGVFLAVTGIAGLFWSGGVFFLAHLVGPAVRDVLARVSGAAWALPLLIVGFWALSAGVRCLLKPVLRGKLLGAVGRWTRWEFWPPWLFYAPVAVYCAWLALRHRGWTVPTAANPGITNGGMVGESKFDTLRELMGVCPEFTASSERLDPGEVGQRLAALDTWMNREGIEYPVVLKPDVGQRGVGVRVARSAADAATYLEEMRSAVVAQRYLPGPFEAGIFYVREPDRERGRIFAITEKRFPVLTGDGIHTVEELIWLDRRARMMGRKYLQRLESRRHEVLPEGATLRLVETGNHAQGSVFRDGREWWSPELEARIDELSRRLEGFHFGRYDVRFESVEELRAGRGFQVLELNGAAAEATNIYDARNSLWTAYRTLFQQWRLAFEIGAANARRGTRPTPVMELLKTWWAARRHFAACPVAD